MYMNPLELKMDKSLILRRSTQNLPEWVENGQISDSVPICPESARIGWKRSNPWFCADLPRICQNGLKMAKSLSLRRSAQNLPELAENGQPDANDIVCFSESQYIALKSKKPKFVNRSPDNGGAKKLNLTPAMRSKLNDDIFD